MQAVFRHPYAPPALLVLCVTALFAPALGLWAGLFHDDLGMATFPRYVFLARCFQNGILPLWDPHTWCGAIPLYARYYSATYYPLIWPFFRFCDTSDLMHAYRVLILVPLWLHYLIGALGFYRLLRRLLSATRPASAVGALVYLFSPAWVYSYSWEQVVYFQAWLPWLLLVFLSAARAWQPWKGVAGGAVAALMITAADPAHWHFAALLMGLALMHGVWFRSPGGGRREVASAVQAAAFMGALGLALSAVYWAPMLDALRYTQEHIPLTAQAAQRETVGSLSPLFLATLFMPGLFGNVTGARLQALNPSDPVLFWEGNLCGGMAVSLLVCVGVAGVLLAPAADETARRRRWWVAVFAALYAGAVLAALGRHTPFYQVLVGWIPGVGGLPRPIRYRFLQCLAAGVLVCAGVDVLGRLKAGEARRPGWLKVLVAVYLAVAGLAVSAGMLLPLHPSLQVASEWSDPVHTHGADGTPGFGTPDGWLPEGVSAGNFSPSQCVVRIAACFDGPSEGEIRYAEHIETVHESEGLVAGRYQAAGAGWHCFEARIPPSRYVWLLPQKGQGRLGRRPFEETPAEGFVFDRGGARWTSLENADILCFEQQRVQGKSSMIFKLLSGDPLVPWIVLSIFLWLWMTTVIGLGVCWLPVRMLAGGLALLAVCEALAWGSCAFYGGTYSLDRIFPNQQRAVGPEHPVAVRALQAFAGLGADGMRTASDEPFHDNFMQIAGGGALLGYEMHPLERRFKQAVELAYGQPMTYAIYYGQPRPRRIGWPFLNHFSVAAMLSASPEPLFSGGRVQAVPGDETYRLHWNPRALPRAYVMDRVVAADPDTQIRELVCGDLRRAVYVDEAARAPLGVSGAVIDGPGDPDRFDALQKDCPVTALDLSDPNRVTLSVRTDRPAMLVMTDVYLPGWTAAVDGNPSPVYRVNGCQRGVWLSPGAHRVELRLLPPVWAAGALLSLLALAAAGLLVRGRRGRRP